MANSNIKVKTSDLELKDRLVAIKRVSKTTKGGRTMSFSAIVVVGNEAGVVGYGLGKASEVQSAIAKGVEDAKKNLVKIPVINGTIPHSQEFRYGGSEVLMRPAAPGTGVKAGGAMRVVFESKSIYGEIKFPSCKRSLFAFNNSLISSSDAPSNPGVATFQSKFLAAQPK